MGQSTLSEFELLKKQRDAAVSRTVEPIDRNFISNANLLVAKAIQKGDLGLAEKIKREIIDCKSKGIKKEIREKLVSETWKGGDWTGHFDESGNFQTSRSNSATYSILDDGTIKMDWKSGVKSILIPNSDWSELQEKGGGNTLFKRVTP